MSFDIFDLQGTSFANFLPGYTWFADYNANSIRDLENGFATYNFSLPPTNYVINNSMVTGISFPGQQPCPMSSLAYDAELGKPVALQPVLANKLEIGESGLYLTGEENAFLILGNEGEGIAKLQGLLAANKEIDTLAIFSKSGFEVNNLTVKNIRHLILVTTSFRELFGAESVTPEAFAQTKYDRNLGRFKVDGSLAALNTDIEVYASWHNCEAKILARSYQLHLHTNLAANLGVSTCKFEKGDVAVYLDEIIDLIVPDIKVNGLAKIIAPNTIGEINRVEAISPVDRQYTGRVVLGFKGLKTSKDTWVEASGGILLKVDGFAERNLNGFYNGTFVELDSVDGVNSYAAIRAYNDLQFKGRYLELMSGNMQINGHSRFVIDEFLKLNQGTEISTGTVVVENSEGKRISGKVELLSARFIIDKDALIRTAGGLFLSRTSDLLAKEPKLIGGNNHPQSWCGSTSERHYCYAQASIYQDVFKGTDLSLFETQGDLYLDTPLLESYASNLDVRGVILFIRDDEQKAQVRVICKPLQLYAEGMHIGGNMPNEGHKYCSGRTSLVLQAAGFQNIIVHGYSGWPGTRDYSQVYEIIPSVIRAGQGVVGNFSETFVGCTKDTGHQPLAIADAANYAKAITGGNFNLGLVAGNNALALQQAGGISKIAMQDPNRAETARDLIGEPNLNGFREDGYIANDKLLLSSGNVEVGTEQYNYLFKAQYPSLFSCGIDITVILKYFGLTPDKAGKIFCDADCQSDLVKTMSYDKTGTGLESASASIASYLEEQRKLTEGDLSVAQKDCLIVTKLLENAIDMHKKLGLVLGTKPTEEQLKQVNVPYIWPVYMPYKGSFYLAPNLILPPETAKLSPAWFGAAMVAGGISDFTTTSLLIGGALFANGGVITAENGLVFGRLIKFGNEPLKVEFTQNLAVVSQVVHEYTSTYGMSGVNYERLSYAGIEARDDVFYLLVRNDLLFQGVWLKGTIVAEVGNEAYILTGKQISASYTQFGKGYAVVATLTNIPNIVDGHLSITAVKGGVAVGVIATPGSSIAAQSTEGAFSFSPAKDLSYGKHFTKTKTMISTKTRTTEEYHENLVGNTFGLPGLPMQSFTVVAYGDTILAAAQIYTMHIYLEAGKGNPEHKDLLISSEAITNWKKTQLTSTGFKPGLSDGKLTYLEKKTKNQFDGYNTQVPTVIVLYGDGEAALVSNGRVYVLSSTIDANDGSVHFHAPDGVYLKALDDHELHFVRLDELEVGWGFTANREELSIKEGVFFHSHSKNTEIHTPVPTKINTKLLKIDTNFLHTQGVMLSYKDAVINALKHVDEPALIRFIQDSKTQEGFVGVKLGVKQNLSSALENTKKLQKSNLDDGSGVLNTFFSINQALASWIKAYAQPVEGGVYITASFHADKMHIEKVVPVVSRYTSSGHTELKGDQMIFTGTQFAGVSMYVDARELEGTYAASSFESQYGDYGVNIDIPVTGGVPTLDLSGGVASAEAQTVHMFRIAMAGNLEFKITGKASLDGAAIDAKSIKMDLGELFIRSAQDIARNDGFRGKIGFNAVADVKQFFHAGGIQYKRGDSKWIGELSHIIGTENVEILVAGVLKMAGAMIANAEYDANGRLTDKGKLYVKAVELVVETIHGYDKGVLLGASLDLATGPDGYMNTYGADFGFRDHIQTAMSSIGNGIVDVGNIVGEYTRNIQEAVTVVKNGIKEINARYTTIDFTKLHERTKDSTVFDRAYEGAAKPFVHLYKGAQHIITGIGDATKQFFENLESDGDAEPDERETYLTDESPDSEAPSISDIVHNFYTWLAGDGGNGDGEPEVDLSALSEEDQDAVKAFDQIIKAEVDDALIIEVPLPPIGEELDQAAIDKARLSNTKKLGQILLRASERYHEFAEENPTIAEYGLTVASGVVQTLLGGPVGTANFVRGQATGAVMGALTAEAREQAITSLAGEMKGLAPELSVEESRALAAATIIIPEGAAGGTTAIKQVITSIKVKVKKEYLPSVEKVGNRHPINGDYAGKTFKMEDVHPTYKKQYPDLVEKYPNGVKFNEKGFPELEPYATHKVKIEGLKGDTYHDFKDANKAAGLKAKPDGYTWHHHEDGKTMLLVPKDLHESVVHTGGASTIKHNHNIKD